MKRIGYLCTSFLIFCSSLAFGANDKVLHSEYEPDGHKFTTSLVARMAGYSPMDALELGFYSQAPDQSWKYDAVKVAFWGLFYWCYRWRILAILHSLHGGNAQDIENRRTKLALLIKEADIKELRRTNKLWQVGFLIHALGDSYAHTYNDGKDQRAYGSFVGHGFDLGCKSGNAPDVILKHPERYGNYVRALVRALRRDDGDLNPVPDDLVEEYIQAVIDASKDAKKVEDSCKATFQSGIVEWEKSKEEFPVDKDTIELAQAKEIEWGQTIKFEDVNQFLKDLKRKLNDN